MKWNPGIKQQKLSKEMVMSDILLEKLLNSCSIKKKHLNYFFCCCVNVNA